MGFASLREDIVNRLNDHSEFIQKALTPGALAEAAARKHAQEFINDMRNKISDVWDILDMATHPDVDLAHENQVLNRKLGESLRRNRELEAQARELITKNEAWRKAHAETQESIKRLKADLKVYQSDDAYKRLMEDSLE